MAKDLSDLKWIEELLPQGYRRKPMFGGFGYYLNELLILVMFESTGDRQYKNIIVDFDLWNGCMFPVEKDKQAGVVLKFPLLFPHPVLPKWLYLPVQTEDFEVCVEKILKDIRSPHNPFGVIPNSKAKNKKIKAIETVSKQELKHIDTRRPRMFSDEPFEIQRRKAKKISDLKNLGPVTEKEFFKAGIKTIDQFVKLGWQKTLLKLVKSNPKNCHAIFAYALIGALHNQLWNAISEDNKTAAKDFCRALKKKKA